MVSRLGNLPLVTGLSHLEHLSEGGYLFRFARAHPNCPQTHCAWLKYSILVDKMGLRQLSKLLQLSKIMLQHNSP